MNSAQLNGRKPTVKKALNGNQVLLIPPGRMALASVAYTYFFDRARTLMLDAPHIPQRFWVDVLKYALDITNRLPTSTILFNSPIPLGVNTNTKISPSPYKPPLAAWTNSPTSITKYRRWGCPAWVHRHGSDKSINKFDSRSKCCFMIGQISDQQYRVWGPYQYSIYYQRCYIWWRMQGSYNYSSNGYCLQRPQYPK